jgi:hypothetical protein
VTRGGLSTIIFSQQIVIPSEFKNLTSENEGPTIFKVLLIVNEENIKQIAFDVEPEQRKLHLS